MNRREMIVASAAAIAGCATPAIASSASNVIRLKSESMTTIALDVKYLGGNRWIRLDRVYAYRKDGTRYLLRFIKTEVTCQKEPKLWLNICSNEKPEELRQRQGDTWGWLSNGEPFRRSFV